MDVNEGIDQKANHDDSGQYGIDNKHCNSFEDRHSAGFTIKPMVRGEKIIKHIDKYHKGANA
jgi:hypothetical protein